jgi:chaperonin GroES
MEDRMKFRPLHDRVVVKHIDAEDKTAGGISKEEACNRNLILRNPPSRAALGLWA